MLFGGQRETLIRQLETNTQEIESTLQELDMHEESEEQNYQMLVLGLSVVDKSPSNRHHRSNDDCLEGKRENYQVCSLHHNCAQCNAHT